MERKKLKLSKKGKITIYISLGVTVVALMFAVYKMLPGETTPEIPDTSSVTEYIQGKNPTEVQSTAYDALIAAIDSENQEDQAKYVAVNFVLDFFTWSNLTARENIGGLTYVIPDLRNNFGMQAIDEYYLNFEEFKKKYGSSGMCEVEKYEVIKVGQSKFIYEADKSAKAIDYTISITYKSKASGMPTDGLKSQTVITVLPIEGRYYVAGVDYVNK